MRDLGASHTRLLTRLSKRGSSKTWMASKTGERPPLTRQLSLWSMKRIRLPRSHHRRKFSILRLSWIIERSSHKSFQARCLLMLKRIKCSLKLGMATKTSLWGERPTTKLLHRGWEINLKGIPRTLICQARSIWGLQKKGVRPRTISPLIYIGGLIVSPHS